MVGGGGVWCEVEVGWGGVGWGVVVRVGRRRGMERVWWRGCSVERVWCGEGVVWRDGGMIEVTEELKQCINVLEKTYNTCINVSCDHPKTCNTSSVICTAMTISNIQRISHTHFYVIGVTQGVGHDHVCSYSYVM